MVCTWGRDGDALVISFDVTNCFDFVTGGVVICGVEETIAPFDVITGSDVFVGGTLAVV